METATLLYSAFEIYSRQTAQTTWILQPAEAFSFNWIIRSVLSPGLLPCLDPLVRLGVHPLWKLRFSSPLINWDTKPSEPEIYFLLEDFKVQISEIFNKIKILWQKIYTMGIDDW
jgi:hypothetical protein